MFHNRSKLLLPRLFVVKLKLWERNEQQELHPQHLSGGRAIIEICEVGETVLLNATDLMKRKMDMMRVKTHPQLTSTLNPKRKDTRDGEELGDHSHHQGVVEMMLMIQKQPGEYLVHLLHLMAVQNLLPGEEAAIAVTPDMLA